MEGPASLAPDMPTPQAVHEALSRRGIIARPLAINAILRQLRVETSPVTALQELLRLLEAHLERESRDSASPPPPPLLPPPSPFSP